jgi:hypothetical protein
MEEAVLATDILPIEIWYLIAEVLPWPDVIELRNSLVLFREDPRIREIALKSFHKDDFWKTINLRTFFGEVSPAFHVGAASFFKSPTREVAQVLHDEVDRIKLALASDDGFGLFNRGGQPQLKKMKSRYSRALTLFPENEAIVEKIENNNSEQVIKNARFNGNAILIAKLFCMLAIIYFNSVYLFKSPKVGLRLLGIGLSILSTVPIVVPSLRNALYPEDRATPFLNAIKDAESKVVSMKKTQ